MPSHDTVLLVGSVPAADAEAVFRLLAKELGARAKRYPDGETGERINWIRWQKRSYDENPGMVLADPAAVVPGYVDAIPRPLYKVRAPDQVRFGNLRFADAAKQSYAVFERLKTEGVIPASVKFQVSLPSRSRS